MTERLGGHVWSYEEWVHFTAEDDASQETDALWLDVDGTYERYLGFDPYQTGTWSISADRALELVPDGSPGATTLRLPVTDSSKSSLTLEIPPPAGAEGVVPPKSRTYGASETCPPYLSRIDGAYAGYFLDIHEPTTQYEGWQALDFDSEGDLHVIAGHFDVHQRGFYATTFGARCGLTLHGFAPETAAVMEIDAADLLHVAYAEGVAVKYATRPARAAADVPFTVTEVGTNTGSAPTLALAIAPDGAAAIVSSRDDLGYTVYQSRDPAAASPDWQFAALPISKEAGNNLLFGVSAAYDAESRLHVAATSEGTVITVFRDDEGQWTELPLPPMPVVGSFFEGPKAFRIDGAGRWHLVAGSIGQPPSGFGPGGPGALVYGTGTADDFTWTVVGAGGTASIDLDDRGRVHLGSFDRIFGGLHTIIDGDTITRFRALGREATLDRDTMAAGPKGRVGLGSAAAVQVSLPPDELPEATTTVRVRLTDAQGARVVFPELGQSCADECSFEVTTGRWIRWTTETPAGIAPVLTGADACRGRELTGDCWLLAAHSGCPAGVCPPDLDLRFARSDLVAFHDVVPAAEQNVGWTPGGPGATAGGGVAMTLASNVSSIGSRVVRWSPELTPRGVVAFPAWGGARTAVWRADGGAVVFGAAEAGATIGAETGFAGEQVAVGVDAAGAVQWVHRGAAAVFPTGPPVVAGDEVAFFGDGAVVRLRADGTPRFSTPLPGPGDRVDASLVADGERVHVLGPLSELASQSLAWSTRWTRLGPTGAVEDERDIPGWVLGAARDGQGRLVMALALRGGQPWDGVTVPTDALALATYAADGTPVALGAPDSRHFAAAGDFSGWAPLAAGVALRDDGSLVVAEEIRPRVTAVFEFKPDEVAWSVQLGAQAAFGGSARPFAPTGFVRAGPHLLLGGQAQGSFEYGAVSASFQSLTPTMVELP
ncbi:MAG: hypothetical protein H6744_03095 [Deltaproteobacteria bacterium]|nr:hypothetical protein [Deltaproteobacteria bacterium]MCB9785661.1 hypothetical protein [Deltaproteobacteria bacterium]